MFEPDILISARDGAEVHVVVEVKASVAGLDLVQDELRRFMVLTNCPVGLLVAPNRVRLFRNWYRSYTADSVELLGDYTVTLFDEWANMPADERGAYMSRFESVVQHWLERLTDASAVEALPTPLRSALEDEVVPYIRAGEVRAAHHRYPASRASDRGQRP